MQHYGWASLIASHHSAKFGDHSHFGSGDIMFLVRSKVLTSITSKANGKFDLGHMLHG